MNDFAVYLFYLFVFSPTYKVVKKEIPYLQGKRISSHGDKDRKKSPIQINKFVFFIGVYLL